MTLPASAMFWLSLIHISHQLAELVHNIGQAFALNDVEIVIFLGHRDLHCDLPLKAHGFGSVDAVQVDGGSRKFLHHKRCSGLWLGRQGIVDYLAGQSVLHCAQNCLLYTSRCV